jgi:hypothetical protein
VLLERLDDIEEHATNFIERATTIVMHLSNSYRVLESWFSITSTFFKASTCSSLGSS